MANGSFYQNGLPISSVETGVGNLPTTHPPANPASSSFYLSGSVYQTLANQDALLATITADTALVVTDLGLANTAAANAAASAAAAAATLASSLKIANNLSDLASVPTALTNLGLNNVNNTSDVNKPVSTAQATADALVASNAAAATSSLSSSTTTSLALKAPLASPALTGVPTAPTAAALTNSTQLSTTAYADAAVSTLSGTTTTALALKAPLASPALTGVPTAPTATAGTNTTQIASTAFVAASVSASGVTNIGGQIGALTIAGGALSSTVIPVSRYDAAQSLTAAQQDQARANIAYVGRNKIIDGGFTINQRAYVSALALGAGVYGHDRWKAGASGVAYSFTQLASPTTITIAASKSLIQVVENVNVEGGTYTLSWSGIATGRVTINSATPSGNFAVSPITVTGQTAGTTMSVEFTGANAVGTSAVATNTGTLSTVQLEFGTQPTPFEFRSYPHELALCQRYCELMGVGYAGVAFSTTQAALATAFKSVKQATPTAVLANGTGAIAEPGIGVFTVSSIATNNSDIYGCYLVVNSSGLTSGKFVLGWLVPGGVRMESEL
jgi:hypothetical protein